MDQRYSNVNSRTKNIATVSESVKMSKDNYFKLVKQRFKQKSEMPIALFEAYQVVGNRHSNRLLALVISTGTKAIFCFNVKKLPPQSILDLSIIDKIFPLNDSFEMKAGKMENQFCTQFSLTSFNETTSEFFPLNNGNAFNNFEEFQMLVNKNKDDNARERKSSMPSLIKSFGWLSAYQKQDTTHCRIYCATWNINSLSCPPDDLSLWLARSNEPPDIYVIALQELEFYLGSMVTNASTPNDKWNLKFMESLHSNAIYKQLTSVRLVGMQLTIFVKEELFQCVISCNTHIVTTGFCSQFGNKGCVAVSVKFNDANICFVNSHLAAGMTKFEERNKDYDAINKECVFQDNRHILDHDHIFWIGDLNYRINQIQGKSFDYSDYKKVLLYDQLIMEMKLNRIFKNYEEGAIEFPPTYKYDIGTDNFDTSEKHRLPAYCDRVLFKGKGINQISYKSAMQIRQSDHKPVYAEFIIALRSISVQQEERQDEDITSHQGQIQISSAEGRSWSS